MNKLYLCTSVKSAKDFDKAWITKQHPSKNIDGNILRYSPIFKIDESENYDPLSCKRGFILFFFTVDSYFLIGKLSREKPVYRDRIYVSNGLASIILFLDDKDQVNELVNHAMSHIVAYEVWNINVPNLAIEKVEITNNPGEVKPFEFEGSKSLGREEEHVFCEIIQSLNYAIRLSTIYCKNYLSLFEQVSCEVQEILSTILYLKDQISLDALLVVMSKLYVDDFTFDQKLYANKISKTKEESLDRITHLTQLKDEAVTISAVLKSINAQAFSGACPILLNPYRSGEYSLLGIGGGFASLFSIYTHVRSVFTNYKIEAYVANEFNKQDAPPLCLDERKYEAWKKSLEKYDGVKTLKPVGNKTKSAFHLLYFSNRLGFRETKHSISAAYQTLPFASRPTWSMATLSHEFFHAINRSILSKLYPKGNNDGEDINSLYEKYKNRYSEDFSRLKMDDFFKLIIIGTISELTGNIKGNRENETESGRYLPKSTLIEGLNSWHHQIDEIMVHILDYNYFYRGRTDIYIKGIWTTWLTIPVTLSRIDEYLLRSICAISSGKDGTRTDRFHWSYNTLQSELTNLLETGYIPKELLEQVLVVLTNNATKVDLLHKHSYLCKLIDVTYEYLLSTDIINDIFVDDLANQQPGLMEYSYEVSPGDYEQMRIQSPIMFLLSYARDAINNPERILNNSQTEFNSVWLMSVLTSALYREEVPHDYK